ncbi:acyloxyacyl hydrolase [Geobacter sp. AOG1]|uniref:acyloxyacyl hydrolase n=1 Tax=Geobacter sp. AOG1 TaxID=1566346 RepID=UPI001CC374CB|nr:acyloxyacyl hydrolase [Geobacter sp. AOG1]GFE56337.1 lipid A 3-O-deacylase [Geobacter sp. AOG1]
MTRILLTIIVALVLVPATVSAADNAFVRDASHEYTWLAGYGVTHRDFGATRTDVQTFTNILRYGWFLSDEVGKGNWYQGRHELLLELPLHVAVNHDGRVMTGGYALGSWKFTSLEQMVPYVFAGGGVLFVDLGLPTMGTRLDFSYQGGTGLQYFIRKDLALTGEYRYHHVSNANTATPNEPLNSSLFTVGISLFR